MRFADKLGEIYMIVAIIYMISGISSTFLCLCCMKSNKEREKAANALQRQ
jgi:uncharacterized membrane protein YuzA (DUF378 family)